MTQNTLKHSKNDQMLVFFINALWPGYHSMEGKCANNKERQTKINYTMATEYKIFLPWVTYSIENAKPNFFFLFDS